MIYPVRNWPTWYSAQKFGAQTDYGYHEAEDLNLKTGGDTDLGQDILAITDGIVTSVHNHTSSNNFGKHIHIKHDGPWGTVWSHYAHCSEILVKEGEKVTEGQVVAKVGKSGTVYSHLHWAIKLQPTGIEGIAKTLDDLKKWTAPIEFVEKWKSIPQPMPENTDLQRIFNYYQVKTADELIHMVDEQIEFLKKEREKTSQLSEQITGMNTTIQASRDKFSTFVQTIVDKLNPIHPIMGTADEIVCLGLIDELVASATNLQSEIKKQQKLADEAALKAAERERELGRQITVLETKAAGLELQVEDLQKDIEKVKQNQQTHDQQTAQNDALQAVIQTLSNIFKGKS